MELPKAGTIEIAPSVLSADFSRLGDEVALIKTAGIKIVHLDVMDGHFVPNLTIGPVVIKHIRKCSDLFFDAHLMITDPSKYADSFIDAGVNHITFHIEVEDEPEKLIEHLHNRGVTAGVCVNPETPVDSIKNVAHLCDMVLVMTVHPGFGGQKFMEDAARKIIDVRKMVGDAIRVEVDGGVGPETAKKVVDYGADTLVAGSAVFGTDDTLAAIKALKESAGII